MLVSYDITEARYRVPVALFGLILFGRVTSTLTSGDAAGAACPPCCIITGAAGVFDVAAISVALSTDAAGVFADCGFDCIVAVCLLCVPAAGITAPRFSGASVSIDLLGTIPIETALRQSGDNGKPYVEFFKNTRIEKEMISIAKKIRKNLINFKNV